MPAMLVAVDNQGIACPIPHVLPTPDSGPELKCKPDNRRPRQLLFLRIWIIRQLLELWQIVLIAQYTA